MLALQKDFLVKQETTAKEMPSPVNKVGADIRKAQFHLDLVSLQSKVDSSLTRYF